ncbi:MAG: hypothetical protein ACI4AQ_02085 [Lachnospiraceae bacterium]
MRIWFREFHNTHMLKDMVVEDYSEDNRTRKIFRAIDEMCVKFDLGQPIWLDSNIEEFKRYSKVRFRADNFIEEIDFDYLEIQVIEED